METPISYITKTVLNRLKNTVIPGIQKEEIHILPEGRAPATTGERCIIISPGVLTTVNNLSDFRGKKLYFRVNLIRRIRSIPNDRFGTIYVDSKEAHEIHTVIEDTVQSLNMFRDLLLYIKNIEDTEPLQTKYSASGTFTHRNTIYDPIHLYPGFFHSTVSEADSSLAGYRTYSAFTSPTFYLIQNPLLCIET